MRNWLEVDLNKLSYNLDVVKDTLPEDCQIIAIVKANAYGHGEAKVSRALEDLGIKYFAVASLGEAINLRDARINGEILLLSYVDPEDLPECYANDVTITLVSPEFAEEISKVAVQNGFTIKAHIKLNTGMNRVGFECNTDEDLEKISAAYKLPGIEVKGIFSHFSSSDDLSDGADEYTKMQLEKYSKAIEWLENKGIKTGLKHISNSGAIGKYKEARFDAVRCGALMYGYNTAVDAPLPVKPIGTWKTVVSCVRTLKTGDAVSYSRHFIAKGGEKIASLCVGYADGYKRELSGHIGGGFVLIGGKKCPILGSICMDQMMVDVTGMDVKCGDIAILMGSELSADTLAEKAGTCMHDIISCIGPRVERIYIEE